MYMTNEAIRLKNAKGRLWNRYVATRTKHDREKYTQCKNSLQALTRNLKRDFEQNLACNLKGKPKTFWKYVKSRLKTRQSIPSLTKPNGSKATTPKRKADTLNDFFVGVFTIENRQNIPPPPTCHVKENLQSINIT